MKSILIAAALVGNAAVARAQTLRPLTPPADFTLDQWTTVNGLPQNSVNAVAQTPDGYIWVGTFGGLARFDGLRFNVIGRVDSAGRHVDRVLSLAVAPDSALWIGTENGLLRYQAGRFRQFTTADGLPDNEIRALMFDHTGLLWIGTEHGGAARHEAGRFVAIHEVDGIPFSSVYSLAEDRSGVIWINATGHFLALQPHGTPPIRQREVANKPVDVMEIEDRTGTLWFRLLDRVVPPEPAGLARVRDHSIELFRVGFGPEVMIEQDRPDRYWFTTFAHGVVEFRPGGRPHTRTYPLPDGSSVYGARALLDGHDGNVWVGTQRDGLLRLKRNLFTTYRATNGLSQDAITSVMETRDGSLWAGTNCGGVNVLEAGRRVVRTYMNARPGTPGVDPCVFAMAQDSSGVVWVGTYGGGLTRIEHGRAERVGGLNVLRDSVIIALFTDRGGTLWVGMKAGGLAAVQGRTVRRVYTTADGLPSNSVHSITQTRDGALWVGTLGGLSRLAPDGRVTSYTAKDGLSSEYVRAIYEDEQGALWVGTYGGGLNRLRNGRFVPITRTDGLADDVVSAILDDGRGNFWMSGNRGVYRIAKAQLNRFADGALRRVHCVLYGVGDGLVNAETNGGFQPSAWKDHTGRLWFPTIDGLASVDPARAIDIPRPPPVTVDGVVVDGEDQSAGHAVESGPGRPNVEFRYTAPSLSGTENVTFRYRLEGLDDDWVEPGTRRVAYYSRLPAGHYRFFVTAANRDGEWNASAATLSLRVLAPLYRRPWFVIVTLLAVGVLLWSAHRALLHTRSAAIRVERSRLAREIHDSLLQGFGGIALELDAASTRLALPPAQQPLLDRVLALIDRTLTQARQAVWDIRPSGPAIQDFAFECDEAARRILSGTVTQFSLVAQGRKRRLTSECQVESLRIVEEALTNVRKHAAAGRVTLRLVYRWRRLEVMIVDNGRGFDPERDGRRSGHWGWLGMRERASRIGGRVALVSTPGAGTTVSIVVPYHPGFWSRFFAPPGKD